MPDDPLYVLAVLALAVALSEELVRRTILRHVGTALLVIVVVAVFANVGIVPAYSPDVVVYEGIFGFGVYLGIFWLLLGVGLRDLRRAGGAMLALFAIGALGTVAGVLVGLYAIDARAVVGEHWTAFGGMFVATYTGGSANLNMIAADYGVARDGALYTGANAVDAIMTTVWMVATIALPRILWRVLPRERREGAGAAEVDPAVLEAAMDDGERVDPVHLGVLVALGAGAYFVSSEITAWANATLEDAGVGLRVPIALVITTLALALAQVPAVARLSGARLLGVFALYLFLAVIGALCDLAALEQLGRQAGALFAFVAVAIAIHGLVCFGLAGLFRMDWDMAAVASQANVGGGTTAMALARSLGRPDLVVPGILVGSLGTASGTYLGIATIHLLRGG